MTPEITDDLIARQSPEAQAIIRAPLAKIAAREARLNQSPRGAPRPPSTEPPHAEPRRSKAPGERTPGGPPGHTKHPRPLLPPEQCTAALPLKPSAGRRCGRALAGDDPAPLRHQVRELPAIEPPVTEYRRHRLACPRCGDATCAPRPAGAPAGPSGPRRVAAAGRLRAYVRRRERRTALLLEALLNPPCGPALPRTVQAQVTAALRPAYGDLAAAPPAAPQRGIDEAPTKGAGTRAWRWTVVAGLFTAFAARGSRAGPALTTSLTDRFAGVVSCDRAKMYRAVGRLPWGGAHLRRDFQAPADRDDRVVRRLGHDLLRPTREMFRPGSRCRAGTVGRAELKRDSAPVRQQVEGVLPRGVFRGHPRPEGMCREQYDHRAWLWTFLDQEIEPTKNASGRALRHAVIWRKWSFGTRSAGGSRLVETLLTVIETCRQQSRDAFAYVTAAVEAHFADQPPPSLRPGV